LVSIQRLSVIALDIREPLVVEYYTTNRSALGGVLAIGGIDYSSKRGRWVFLPGGHTTTNLDVEVFGNTSDDYDRSFEVRWFPLSDVPLASTNVVVTILDDDLPPRLVLSSLELRVAEGNRGTVLASLTLELQPPSGKVVEVQFSSSNGTAVADRDFIPLDPIGVDYVRFQPLQSQVTITNLVRLIDNNFNEPDRDFFIDAQVDPTFAILDPSQSRIHVTIVDDDPLPTLAIRSTAASDVVEGNSGVTNAIFSVSLTPQSGRPVTVQFATMADGNATAGADYRLASGTLTFQSGETNKNVIVEVLGDVLHEGTESFFVALSIPMNAVVSTSQAQGRIFDDEAAPVVSIQDASFVVEGTAGTTNATFQVALSAASSQIVTVNFSTSNGTAAEGMDFVGKTNTLTFLPGGPLVQFIAVGVTGDNLSEPDETFFANLSDPVGATLGRNQATGTITDDDPVPSISIQSATVAEGNGATNAVFTMILSSPSGLPVTVSFAATNQTAVADSDYLPAQGTVRFDPGVTNQTIRIPIIGDAIHEDSETFLVRLSAAQNATISVGEAIGSILDDDPLTEISIADATVIEGNSGIINAVFLVTLSAPSGVPVTVNLATADDTALAGKDYSRFESTLAFAPGQTNLTFTVPVLGDLSNESNEVFLIRLASPTNATIAKTEGRALIIDDDPLPVLTINGGSVPEGNTSVTSAEFNVVLFPASGQTVTVSFATADGTATAPGDYASLSGTLTFVPGETNKAISVSIEGDTEDEPNETLFVRLSNANKAVVQVAEGQSVLINDDTVPALTISDATVSEGNSGMTNAVFVVSLAQPSGRPVTVEFSTADGTALAGSDFVAATNKVTFNPGQTSQTISVAVTADALNEKTETFFVNLFNPESATLARKQGQAL
ncbi:MAG: Na-Ca exchanger/integrin-beta4, partial [Planctomycetota bacterium]